MRATILSQKARRYIFVKFIEEVEEINERKKKKDREGREREIYRSTFQRFPKGFKKARRHIFNTVTFANFCFELYALEPHKIP
jgi:hypothetical protein